MSPKVRYQTPEGVQTVERTKVGTNENYVSCYENPDDVAGVEDKIEIPRERVIEVLY